MSERLVVCSLERWDEVWRRNQHLVAGLLRRDPGLEVLVVEPSRDPLHELRSRRAPGPARGLRVVPGTDGRLRTLQLTKWLPRAAGPTADALLRRGVRRVVARLGWADPLLWVNDPGWAGLVTETGWPTLYDVTDDWLEAVRDARARARLVAQEATLLREARAVVVCSPRLAVSKAGERPVTLVPNAVDVERYRRPAARPADLPPPPVAVYVGTLHEDRLDVPLTAATARELAAVGASLALVGPDSLSTVSRDRLLAEPGLRILGPRAYAAVPAYLRHASVLVVPHVVDAFTDSLDPIKLYEYLAVGRPVVSTPVAGFRDALAPTVTSVPAEAFPRAVREAALAGLPDRPDPEVPDWSQRVEQMAEVLAGLR